MIFVLVPGGWQGGWTYDAVAALLRAWGHVVHAVTPAGLGDAPDPGANLDTHVAQVVDVVRRAEGPVVLAGHSYGGMVITGVVDRVPERIAHLVYVDAYVPDADDSCWRLTSDPFRALFVDGAAADGRTVAVPPGLDPRARPHPVASFLQGLRRDDPGASATVPRSYVWGGDWNGSPFADLVARLRADPAWTVHDLLVGHNIMRHDPEGLARVLDAAAAGEARP